MATKTADTPQADTPASTPGERSIGKDANIAFNDTGATGSFNVNEQRGQSEDVIKSSIQKTEQAGIARGRKQESDPGITLPPASSREPFQTARVFSPQDSVDTANAVDALLKVRERQTQDNSPSTNPTPQAPITPISSAPIRPAPSIRTQPPAGSRTRRPARNTASATPPPTAPPNTGGEKVMKYTSEGGFLVGKISPRTAERTYAKTQVTTVEKGAREGRVGSQKQMTKGTRAQQLNAFIRKFAQKTVRVLGLTPIEKKAPPALPPEKKVPPPPPGEKTSAAPVPKHRMTLFGLHVPWNKAKIKQAETHGYDRFSLKRQLVNLKTWGNRSWKDTKRFIANPITPVSTRSLAQKSVGQKTRREGLGSFLQSQWSTQEEDTTPATPSSPSGGYFNWSSSRVRQGFFNRSRSPISSWNTRLGGNFGERRSGSMTKSIAKNAEKKAGKKIAGKLAQKAVSQAAQSTAKAVIMNPWVLAGIIIAVVIIVFVVAVLITILGDSGSSDTINAGVGGGTPGNPGGPGTPNANPIPGFTLHKDPESPAVVTKDDQINYSISYTQPTGSVKIEDITIYDKLPDNVTFQSASSPSSYDKSTNTVSWKLSENTSPVKLIVIPKSDNITVINSSYALATGTGGSGSLDGLFPPANTSAAEDAARQAFASAVASHPDSVAAYKEASIQTGIPWEVLAGIHNFESGGRLQTDRSLVSGRLIGENEPDIGRAGGCIENNTPGTPVPVAGGCGFRTFLDSAIYAGNLLVIKNAGKKPASFEEIVKAVYYYGGPGNRNCGEGRENLPYSLNCPATFTGEDDSHAMNKFDLKHEKMYLIYCEDLKLCNPPEELSRIGVMAAADGLNKYFK